MAETILIDGSGNALIDAIGNALVFGEPDPLSFIIEENLAESTFAHAIAMNGTVETATTPSVVGIVSWRWEDEPDMEPQFLGEQTAGHDLAVPFDLQGRTIRLSLESQTLDKQSSVRNIKEAKQIVFYQPTVAILSAISFDTGTDDVTLTIANNGGGGTIRILRQIGSGEFAEVGSVASTATTFVDTTPTVNGTYTYKLIQDGLAGESNSRSVAVDVGEAGTGSPPSNLTGSYNGTDTISLDWTNNGGTGSNYVERKVNIGGNVWGVIATLAASAIDYDNGVTPQPVNALYTFRIRNGSVAGYSNEVAILVPGE